VGLPEPGRPGRAAGIIRDLTGRGVTLRADGDALRVSPRSGLTPDDVALLRQHKAGILRTLDGRLRGLQAQYNRLLARFNRAETYFADPTISGEEERGHVPVVERFTFLSTGLVAEFLCSDIGASKPRETASSARRTIARRDLRKLVNDGVLRSFQLPKGRGGPEYVYCPAGTRVPANAAFVPHLLATARLALTIRAACALSREAPRSFDFLTEYECGRKARRNEMRPDLVFCVGNEKGCGLYLAEVDLATEPMSAMDKRRASIFRKLDWYSTLPNDEITRYCEAFKRNFTGFEESTRFDLRNSEEPSAARTRFVQSYRDLLELDAAEVEALGRLPGTRPSTGFQAGSPAHEARPFMRMWGLDSFAHFREIVNFRLANHLPPEEALPEVPGPRQGELARGAQG